MLSCTLSNCFPVWCRGIPVFPSWFQPPTSVNSNQCQSIQPVPAFTLLLLLRHMFSPVRHNREWCRSVCGRGSGTQLTGVPALGTGTGPPRPGEQPEGQLALQCCFVQPYLLSTNLNVLLLSGTEAITAPTHPALPVASSRNKSLGFMEFIEFKEVYGVFLDGLWRPRQRANCGVVAGANRTPHVPPDSFVGGEWPNS